MKELFCLACGARKKGAGSTVLFKTSQALIYRSILVPINTWFYNAQTHSKRAPQRHSHEDWAGAGDPRIVWQRFSGYLTVVLREIRRLGSGFS
jgi:hypothetical protein